MARPSKIGLDYFSLDVRMFSDIKIRKLIKYHKAQAVSVYMTLLCRIYEKGYFIEYDKDLPFVIAEDCGLDENTIMGIINYCVEVGLFDEVMFKKYKVLTSHGIQNRYVQACAKTKRKLSSELPYLLVDVSQEDVSESTQRKEKKRKENKKEKGIYSEENQVYSEENQVYSEEKGISSEENQVYSEESTQRKEKKRKENKKENDYDVVVRKKGKPTTTTTTDSDIENTLREDSGWQENVRRTFKIRRADVERFLNEFFLVCSSRGKTHADVNDARRHFCDWLRKSGILANALPRSDDAPEVNYRSVWDKTSDELCYSLTEAEAERTFARLRFESFSNGRLVLIADSAETVREIEDRYLELFGKALARNFGQKINVNYRIINKRE